jgi:hypothetical protein
MSLALKAAAARLKILEDRAKDNPLVYFRPTPPQERFLNDPSKIKLLRGGNQVGKTACASVLLLYHCLGIHPVLRTDPPPIEAWLITHSHEQSRTIQGKLYSMIPPSTLHPDCEFVHGKGFRGLAPLVRFTNGSIIRIKTASQGLGLASSTCNLVVIDEPVDMEVWNECLARTLRGGRGGSRGTLAMTMTPVGKDMTYLRQLVSSGKVSDHPAPLTIEATTPRGCNPLLTQKQIDSVTGSFLPIDREARISGSWDVGVLEGRVFENFTDEMISSSPVPAGGEFHFAIGIDHGSQPNTQIAILSVIDMQNPREPRVYILDEYISGMAPPEYHARAILEMLKRNDIEPNMCRWTGDTAHAGSRDKRVKIMSNLLLMRAFEAILGLPPKGLGWRIHTAVKQRFSVYFGASMIHSIMSRKHFWIHPKCERTIKSLQRWVLHRSQARRSEDQWGHCVDALRYNIMPIIDTRYQAPVKMRIG